MTALSVPDELSRKENRRPTLRHGKPRWLKLSPLWRNGLYLLRARLLPLHRSIPLRKPGDVKTQGETAMAKGEQKSNREKKKPKKDKVKTIAAAPSQKGVGSLQQGNKK